MARIRTIKPEFWEDDKVSKLPFEARLLFIGTWNYADDYGLIPSNPTFLKNKIFPYDENLKINSVKKWLKCLEAAEMLLVFEYGGANYYWIRSFREHQLLDKRYDKSIIPKHIAISITQSYDDKTREYSTCEHVRFESAPEKNTQEGKGRESKVKDSKVSDPEKKSTGLSFGVALAGDFEFTKKELLNSHTWHEEIGRTFKIDPGWMLQKLNEFLQIEILLKEDWHKGIKEVKSHFIAWLKKTNRKKCYHKKRKIKLKRFRRPDQ